MKCTFLIRDDSDALVKDAGVSAEPLLDVCRADKKGGVIVKNIPDFDIELSQATDYIMESPFAKKTFSKPPFLQYTNVLRTLIQSIDRLADNCHMPEFTNHALPHICSIVRRASEWAVEDKWIDKINEAEAGYLLIALIIHDIGMLSQDASDLPEDNKNANMKGFADISNWIRRTHVIRIEGLVMRLLKDEMEQDETLKPHLEVVIGMAASHQKWAWEPGFVSHLDAIRLLGLDVKHIATMNAVIAVCDLLDEDSNRCDTIALIKYRHGTMENMAHWIRHALTMEVAEVRDHTVTVSFRKLVPSEKKHEKIYRGLRNHYRLVRLYNEQLAVLGAEIKHLVFLPADGIPERTDEMAEELSNIWMKLPEFKGCITEQLLSTFMQEALNCDGGNPDMRKRLDEIGLETIELSDELKFIESDTVCYAEEKILSSLENFKEQIAYLKEIVEEAYLDGQIGKVRHLSYVAWKKWKGKASLNDVYWIYSFLSIFEKYGNECREITSEYQNSVLPVFLPHTYDKLILEGDYQYLFDVWFLLLEPRISDEWLEKYELRLKECTYEHIYDDLASELLLENIIGMFWYYESEGERWLRVAEYFVVKLKVSAPVLANRVQKYTQQLKMQNSILYQSEAETGDTGDYEQSAFTRAWKDFWNEDWKGVEKDIPILCKIANRNRDYQGSVQGFLNMVRWSIQITKWRASEESEDSSADEYGEQSEISIGRYRYSRIQLEQQLPAYWQQRNLIIESLIGTCQEYADSSAGERLQLLRLVSFQMLEALRYWNLGGYLDGLHNETKLYYILGTYTDEYGEYCGEGAFLAECFISYIRGISEKELNEEERKTVAEYLVKYEQDDLKRIVAFITEKSVRIQWKCALYVVEVLAESFLAEERKRLLQWLVRYHRYYKEQNRFFDLKQYRFLEKWTADMEPEDWEAISEIIDELFINQHMVIANDRLVNSIMEQAPWQQNVSHLCRMKKYPDNMQKSQEFYSAIITLSRREDADKDCLHEVVIGLIQQLEIKIQQEDKEFVGEERETENEEEDVCSTEQIERMLRMYRELDSLIDVDSLYELEPVRLDLIAEVLSGLKERINKRGNLKGYDSQLLQPVLEEFCNRNWSGAEEKEVIHVIDTIFEWMELYRENMSNMFFHDFCRLLSLIENSGTETERNYITKLVMEKMVRSEFVVKQTENRADGPLNNIKINIGSKNQYDIEITYLLVNNLKGLTEQQQPEAIRYVVRVLKSEEPIIYHYATVLFSYYFLKGKEASRSLAWGGLLCIQGRLRGRDKRGKLICKKIKDAIVELEKSTNWFGESAFRGYAEADPDYCEWREEIESTIAGFSKKY